MKNILFFVISLLSVSGIAQTKKGKASRKSTESNEKDTLVYKQAIKYADLGVAIHSLYALIVKHPENVSYKDSLALIYFQNGSYTQCLRVCEDIVLVKPNDTITLRMVAISYQGLGDIMNALANFDKLVKLPGNAFDLYQKAVLEYRIKRLQESKASIEKVLAKANDKEKITLYLDRDNKQDVPLRAAAFNLYGMIAKDFNDTTSARFLFNKSLELFPDFYFAKANLKLMNDASEADPAEPPPDDGKKEDPKKERKK